MTLWCILYDICGYTCICLGMVESDGRRSPKGRVLILVLAPGDRTPMSSALEVEAEEALDVGIWGTIRSAEELVGNAQFLKGLLKNFRQ